MNGNTCHPGERRDPLPRWIPAFAGMTVLSEGDVR